MPHHCHFYIIVEPTVLSTLNFKLLPSLNFDYSLILCHVPISQRMGSVKRFGDPPVSGEPSMLPKNPTYFNSLRPRRNEQHFADDIFKRMIFNENVWNSIDISLKFVPKGPINNIPALVQIMACRRPGDKPLSGPMMVRLPTHICVTRLQWVNCIDE